MSKQHTRPDVDSLTQQAFFEKPVFRTGDTGVQSKHIIKTFFIWSDNTSIYHYANNFEEPRDLQKQTVPSYQLKTVRTNHKSRIKIKRRKKAPSTFNSGSDLYSTTTHLLQSIGLQLVQRRSIWHHANREHFGSILTQQIQLQSLVPQQVHHTTSLNQNKNRATSELWEKNLTALVNSPTVIIPRNKNCTWEKSWVHKDKNQLVRRQEKKNFHSKQTFYFKGVIVFKTQSASVWRIIRSQIKHEITSQRKT